MAYGLWSHSGVTQQGANQYSRTQFLSRENVLVTTSIAVNPLLSLSLRTRRLPGSLAPCEMWPMWGTVRSSDSWSPVPYYCITAGWPCQAAFSKPPPSLGYQVILNTLFCCIWAETASPKAPVLFSPNPAHTFIKSTFLKFLTYCLRM